MASLSGNQIDTTFQSLVKIGDNDVATSTLKDLTDGVGNVLPIQVSTSAINFTGTVTGLPAAGLVTGGYPDTQITSSSLVTSPPVLPSGSDGSIVLGNGFNNLSSMGIRNVILGETINSVLGSDNVVIGHFTNASGYGVAVGQTASAGYFAVAVGRGNAVAPHSFASLYNARSESDYSIALGYGAFSQGIATIAIGQDSDTDSDGNIAIGYGAQALGGGGFVRGNISIGYQAFNGANSERNTVIGYQASCGSGNRAVAVGQNATASGGRSVAIGTNNTTVQFGGVVIGNYSQANAESAIAIGGYNNYANGLRSIVIGRESTATAQDAVAIGYQITAATASTVTIKRLQMLDYASLNYADDAAAATGGIPLGGVYHTSGTLKIRTV